jgi:hypothetical protein
MGDDFRTSMTFTTLLAGVVDDIRELFRQEFALARYEVRDELIKARVAAVALGVALVAMGAGGLLLLFALARGLAALVGWPVWAGDAVIGALLAVGGALAFRMGRRRLVAVHPMPSQTIKTVRENIGWMTGSKKSDRT